MKKLCSECNQEYADNLDMCPNCGHEDDDRVEELSCHASATSSKEGVVEGLFNKVFDRNNPARKLKKEIESTQFKKQSLISAVQNDIREAIIKRNKVYCQIGMTVYENRDNTPPEDIHTAHFMEIHVLNGIIDDHEKKINEISSRYDEEINTMNKLLDKVLASTPTHSTESQASCSECGCKYVPGADRYCGECGHDLLEVNIDVVDYPQDEASFCGECGTRYIAGEEIFCGECGSKL